MKVQMMETCERLYKLAKRKGKRTTSSECAPESEAPGNGFRHNQTHRTLKSGAFTIRGTENRWLVWCPTVDASGTRRFLEILRGKKTLFFASCEGPGRVKRFSGRERYLGEVNSKAEACWQISKGKIPAKYLKEK